MHNCCGPKRFVTKVLIVYALQINFESLPRSFLHAYRNAHHLPVPSSFKSYHNQAVLSNPNSIGKLSPTMARPASKRRVGKDVLAKAVRRDFMDQGISELDVEAALCYIMRNGSKFLAVQVDKTGADS